MFAFLATKLQVRIDESNPCRRGLGSCRSRIYSATNGAVAGQDCHHIWWTLGYQQRREWLDKNVQMRSEQERCATWTL